MGCLLLMAPVAPVLLPRLHALLQPHFHWALWCIVAYMLLSEWPKDAGRAPAGLPRLWAAWKGLLAGLVTFLLSGLLGLVLSFRSFLPFSGRPAGLLPAFVGLFGAPGLFQGLAGRRPVPPQRPVERLEIGLKEWLHGTLLGAVGGLFATLFPAVTGGIGAWLAGQGAGQRDGRTFLLSQGASRVGYLLGSLLLLFAPSMHQVKGGIAAPLSTVYANPSPRDGLLALAAATLCTGFAFLLSLELGRWFAHLPVRPLQRASTVLLLFVVAATSGPAGLFVALVAAAIGLLPALWGSRRMNALGVVLLPAALNLSGLSECLAGVLGLL
jgi:putative membrane protein